MVTTEKLQSIRQRFEYLEAAMADGTGDFAALSREYAELRPVVERIGAYEQLTQEIASAEALLSE